VFTMPRNTVVAIFVAELETLMDQVPSAAAGHDVDAPPLMTAALRGHQRFHGHGTSFATCKALRQVPGLVHLGLNYVCKDWEEESCNEVHATCARVLKWSTDTVVGAEESKRKVGMPCNPAEPDIDSKGAEIPKSFKDITMILVRKVKKRIAEWKRRMLGLSGTPESSCNARMFDMPWGLLNNEVYKIRGKRPVIDAAQLLMGYPTEVPLGQTVWGMAVHGKTGTWAFDTGGRKAIDHLYQLPQGRGLPADYYLCDSALEPRSCALIGGNMRFACAEWYDPVQCSECEDLGEDLKCEVRGWNDYFSTWARIPIYPRDILGELYRGEWKDVMARPLYASVTFSKRDFRDRDRQIKVIPENLMTKSGPAAEVLDEVQMYTKTPLDLSPNLFKSPAPLGIEIDASLQMLLANMPLVYPPGCRGGDATRHRGTSGVGGLGRTTPRHGSKGFRCRTPILSRRRAVAAIAARSFL